MRFRDLWHRSTVVATAFAALSTFIAPARSAFPVRRPNVLLIITDQQRATMLSCAGNHYLKTPAVDSLAASGIRFERAYCANPVCVPSRFSMMTGVMPSRIGVDHNVKITPQQAGPALIHDAMGQVFRRAGYETAWGGKVHLQDVQAYGFELLTKNEREGLADKCVEFLRKPHERPFLLVASFINPHDICYLAINAAANGTGKAPAVKGGGSEITALNEALRLPAGVSREEFFRSICPPLPANFEIPHGEPPAVRESDFRSFRAYVQDHWTAEQWRMHRWAYARLTERSDRQIGQVLAALRGSGLENNTVVVFTSDHGDMDSAHKMEHKSMPYEEATRVPFIVSFKGVTPAGRVDTTHLVSTGLDLIPTMCDFAGVAVPGSLKGRSVKPLAADQEGQERWREYLVSENERSRVLWTERFKYAVYDHGEPRELLLDLKNDPGEMHNLAADAEHRDVLASHRALLQEWYKHNGEKLDPAFLMRNPQKAAAK